VGLGSESDYVYNKKTKEYLNSKERHLADRLINYQMSNGLTQQQMATILGVDIDDYLLVAFNHPDTTSEQYRLVSNKFDRLTELIHDAMDLHQVSVDGLANSKVVAGIISRIKSQANRGFFDGTEYFTDGLDIEFIDRNKKEIKLYFKHKGYKIHLDKIIDDRVYCVSVTW